MAKNEQSREVNQPVWFDGKSINEALFCDDFLGRHKIIYTNGAFFSPDGRVTNDLPLRSEIFDELRCCAVSNIPRKISNIVELMKLAALVEDFPPETDRIHLANGTLFLNGTFTDGKPEIVRCRLPVAYNPNAPSPTRWLAFLDGLLYAEDAGAEAFRKDIAAMEAGLQKLADQERKYSAELDKVLQKYAEAKAQAAGLDPVELYGARLAIRDTHETAAQEKIERTFGKQYSPIRWMGAQGQARRLLREDTEERETRLLARQVRDTSARRRSAGQER